MTEPAVDFTKKETWTMIKDLTLFLKPVSLAVGAVGLVSVWGASDYAVIDGLLYALFGVDRFSQLLGLTLTMSLAGLLTLVVSSLYHLMRVHRYLRYVTPPKLRWLFAAFSMVYSASATMLGLISVYRVLWMVSEQVRNMDRTVFNVAEAVASEVFASSILMLSACFWILGRSSIRSAGGVRASLVLLVGAVLVAVNRYAGLSVLPLSMIVARAYLLGNGVITDGRRPRDELVTAAACLMLSVLSMSSFVALYAPVEGALQMCPSWLPADAVVLPVDSSQNSYNVLFIISNPTNSVLHVNSTALYVAFGDRYLTVPLFVYESHGGWYSMRLLFCDTCDPVLAPRTTSVHMYRFELYDERLQQPLPVKIEVRPYIERKGHLYACGRMVVQRSIKP